MKPARLLCLFFVSSGQILSPQAPTPAQPAVPEPKTPIEWFQRAYDQTNLRMPGSVPFHMRVNFHAFPGEEFVKKGETPQIITGDGVYEETWLAPHHWRREVTFAGYHAVEVESGKGRKMQASSDYEPSRVLMLLSALLEPVPRYLVSREYQRDRAARGWRIDDLAKAGTSLVRISRVDFSADSGIFTDAFYFVPRGLLLLRNEDGLTTNWSSGATFADKIVFRRITVSAGARTLLEANVTITAEGLAAPADFELDGGPADAWKTLRPFQSFDIRAPALLSADPAWPDARRAALVVDGIVDRNGRYREVEVIVSVNPGADRDLRRLMEDFRKSRWRPAEIDGYPCQRVMRFLNVKEAPRQVGPGREGPS